jgi:hypothetical protein
VHPPREFPDRRARRFDLAANIRGQDGIRHRNVRNDFYRRRQEVVGLFECAGERRRRGLKLDPAPSLGGYFLQRGQQKMPTISGRDIVQGLPNGWKRVKLGSRSDFVLLQQPIFIPCCLHVLLDFAERHPREFFLAEFTPLALVEFVFRAINSAPI